MKFFTAILSALAIAVSTTTATPINARADLIVNLPISNPKEGEMWHPGTTQTVTWDPSGVPPQDNHYTGTIYLGYWSGHNQDEHLDLGELLSLSLPRPVASTNRRSPLLIGKL
jgi:hypothetical protein